MAFSIKAGKGGRKSVPTPGIRPSYVLGSRPETMRANPVPRIKPVLRQTDYGKTAPNVPNPAGASSGLVGNTSDMD